MLFVKEIAVYIYIYIYNIYNVILYLHGDIGTLNKPLFLLQVNDC